MPQGGATYPRVCKRSLVDGLRLAGAVGGSRGAAVMSFVRPAFVVEAEVGFELGVGVDQRAIAFQVDLLVFDGAPQPFDEDVVETTALPSIDSFTPAARSGWVNSAEVNWQPWSVLKISGFPCCAMARCTARTQKLASRVFAAPN